MKKLFFFLFLGVFSLQLNAQVCVPDDTLPDSIVISPLPFLPDSIGTGIMDTACVNSYYETTLYFNIPNTIEVFGTEVPLSSVSMAQTGAVVDLPASYEYTCNPPNCMFEADSSGCISIYGTGTAEDEGIHDLKVAVTIVAGGFSLDRELPDGILVSGNYYFHVKPEGSENCTIIDGINDPIVDNFAVSNSPNPFYSTTDVKIDSKVSGTYDLTVQDMIGNVLQRSKLNIYEGENTFTFDGSSLPAGMYIYTISDGQQSVSNKMLIGNR
jgi:hypothetical protein